MNRPKQLTKNQVQTSNEINSGVPFINEIVEVKVDKKFSYQFPFKENDVYFVDLMKF